MFERKSEGCEKRSQTGNSAALMSSQKTSFFLPRILHKALCMTSDLVCTECELESISEALAEPMHTQVECLLQVEQAIQAETCVCLYCQDLRCVFKCPPESE